jgi:hypothetical protein
MVVVTRSAPRGLELNGFRLIYGADRILRIGRGSAHFARSRIHGLLVYRALIPELVKSLTDATRSGFLRAVFASRAVPTGGASA